MVFIILYPIIMKKLIAYTFFVFMFLPVFVFAKQWCCSRHKWVSHCGANGKYICNDWTQSPTCTCGSTYSRTYNTYTQPSYNYNSYTYPSYTTSSYTAPSYSNTSYNYNNYDYCKSMYGSHAITNSDYSCWCETDYFMMYKNYSKTCMSWLEACKLVHWDNVSYVWNWNCQCNQWYIFNNNNKCELEIEVKAANCNKIANTEFDYSAMICYCKNWYSRNGYACVLNYY